MLATLPFLFLVVYTQQLARAWRSRPSAATVRVSSSALGALSKKAETFAKVKRLKQMINEGKSYQEYLTEKRRYGDGQAAPAAFVDDNDDDEAAEDDATPAIDDDEFKETFRKAVAAGLISKTADPAEVMARVLQYKAANPTPAASSRAPAAAAVTEAAGGPARTIDDAGARVRRVAFLPDCGVDDGRRHFYADLCALFAADMPGASYNFTIVPMPHVYDLNTKRYETQWMGYMRGLGLGEYDVVVGHASSAEALLRYLESEPLTKCVIIDGSDIYTAGERHGRAYLYSRILDHCGSVRLVAASTKGAAEARTLSTELAPARGGKEVVLCVGDGEGEEGARRTARRIFDAIVEEFGIVDI